MPKLETVLVPGSAQDAAAALADAAACGRAVRFCGGGTKHGWGAPVDDDRVELRLQRLDRTLEHNAGDLTAVFEAGVPLARAQRELARAGQRLALDPPLGLPGAGGTGEKATIGGAGEGATIGGVFATADSGPLRHRYGAPRDLILGITVALSDGTLAKAGGKVIKNVAGYDLAKLFCGSFGTLGLIVSVSVRLHPLARCPLTVLGSCADAARLTSAALALAAAPLELEALDVAWRGGRGGILAQLAGAQSRRRADRLAVMMRELGLGGVDVTEQDAPLWERQRAGQRSRDGALVRVLARPTALASLLGACDQAAGTLVGRAALGIYYIQCEPRQLDTLRGALPAGARATLLDAPAQLRAAQAPWGEIEGPALALMRRIKQRFDPALACNPGVFVGGI
jgi:glycolate oxidase FAD binding subunit